MRWPSNWVQIDSPTARCFATDLYGPGGHAPRPSIPCELGDSVRSGCALFHARVGVRVRRSCSDRLFARPNVSAILHCHILIYRAATCSLSEQTGADRRRDVSFALRQAILFLGRRSSRWCTRHVQPRRQIRASQSRMLLRGPRSLCATTCRGAGFSGAEPGGSPTPVGWRLHLQLLEQYGRRVRG